MTEFVTIGELLALAEEHIPKPTIDFILAGSGSEGTVRRNREMLERLAIEQVMLTSSDDIDTATNFLGATLGTPIALAPVGSTAKLYEDGDIEWVRGAGGAGALATVTANSTASFEDVAAAATAPRLFQFHLGTEHAKQREWIDRIESCGSYLGICATVHSQVSTRLDRYLEQRPPLSGGHFPSPRSATDRFGWADVDRVRKQVTLPFGLKGIMSATDAETAIAAGVDYVWVSNHGGRTLDSARAAIDVLEDVAAAVDGRVPIIVDGGFLRGSDVVKAAARGATLVAFGKLAACALAVDGGAGVENLVRILTAELENALSFSGHTTQHTLRPEVLRPT